MFSAAVTLEARLSLLPKIFPDCQIIVLLREPSAHAASLYRQHMNFAKLQAADDFSKRYMGDIGHFEFGALHRPMAFNRDFLTGRDLERPDYWLAYWITSFEHVADHTSNLLLLKQEDLRDNPEQTMDYLITNLGLSHNRSKQWGGYFHREPDVTRSDLFDDELLIRARSVYDHLSSLAIPKKAH